MTKTYVKIKPLTLKNIRIERIYDLYTIEASLENTIPHIEERVLVEILVNQDATITKEEYYLQAIDSMFDWENKELMLVFNSCFICPKQIRFYFIEK